MNLALASKGAAFAKVSEVLVLILFLSHINFSTFIYRERDRDVSSVGVAILTGLRVGSSFGVGSW